MQNSRRFFLKKSVVVGAVAVSGTAAMAMSSKKDNTGSNGVVVGQSLKKEILYKKTAAWEEYYKKAL